MPAKKVWLPKQGQELPTPTSHLSKRACFHIGDNAIYLFHIRLFHDRIANKPYCTSFFLLTIANRLVFGAFSYKNIVTSLVSSIGFAA